MSLRDYINTINAARAGTVTAGANMGMGLVNILGANYTKEDLDRLRAREAAFAGYSPDSSVVRTSEFVSGVAPFLGAGSAAAIPRAAAGLAGKGSALMRVVGPSALMGAARVRGPEESALQDILAASAVPIAMRGAGALVGPGLTKTGALVSRLGRNASTGDKAVLGGLLGGGAAMLGGPPGLAGAIAAAPFAGPGLQAAGHLSSRALRGLRAGGTLSPFNVAARAGSQAVIQDGPEFSVPSPAEKRIRALSDEQEKEAHSKYIGASKETVKEASDETGTTVKEKDTEEKKHQAYFGKSKKETAPVGNPEIESLGRGGAPWIIGTPEEFHMDAASPHKSEAEIAATQDSAYIEAPAQTYEEALASGQLGNDAEVPQEVGIPVHTEYFGTAPEELDEAISPERTPEIFGRADALPASSVVSAPEERPIRGAASAPSIPGGEVLENTMFRDLPSQYQVPVAAALEKFNAMPPAEQKLAMEGAEQVRASGKAAPIESLAQLPSAEEILKLPTDRKGANILKGILAVALGAALGGGAGAALGGVAALGAHTQAKRRDSITKEKFRLQREKQAQAQAKKQAAAQKPAEMSSKAPQKPSKRVSAPKQGQTKGATKTAQSPSKEAPKEALKGAAPAAQALASNLVEAAAQENKRRVKDFMEAPRRDPKTGKALPAPSATERALQMRSFNKESKAKMQADISAALTKASDAVLSDPAGFEAKLYSTEAAVGKALASAGLSKNKARSLIKRVIEDTIKNMDATEVSTKYGTTKGEFLQRFRTFFK